MSENAAHNQVPTLVLRCRATMESFFRDPFKGSPSEMSLSSENQERANSSRLEFGFQMLTGKRILMVEDDPIIAGVYGRYLAHAGCLVEVIVDGQEGLDQITASRPDALLLDLMLPHLNGISILKSIRASEKLKDLPVIVMTNAFAPRIVNDCIAAGATSVFKKSQLTPALLLHELREVLPATPGQEEAAA